MNLCRCGVKEFVAIYQICSHTAIRYAFYPRQPACLQAVVWVMHIKSPQYFSHPPKKTQSQHKEDIGNSSINARQAQLYCVIILFHHPIILCHSLYSSSIRNAIYGFLWHLLTFYVVWMIYQE